MDCANHCENNSRCQSFVMDDSQRQNCNLMSNKSTSGTQKYFVRGVEQYDKIPTIGPDFGLTISQNAPYGITVD